MSILEKAEDKLKQLNEACDLLDDINWKIDWALDFSKYNSINDVLYPLSCQIGEAFSEMESLKESLEEEIESYKDDKALSEGEFDENSSLNYSLS